MAKSHNISIDRIDSSQGYYIENIQLVYPKINMMKFTYSQEEFIDMCKRVSNYSKSMEDEELDVYCLTVNQS